MKLIPKTGEATRLLCEATSRASKFMPASLNYSSGKLFVVSTDYPGKLIYDLTDMFGVNNGLKTAYLFHREISRRIKAISQLNVREIDFEESKVVFRGDNFEYSLGVVRGEPEDFKIQFNPEKARRVNVADILKYKGLIEEQEGVRNVYLFDGRICITDKYIFVDMAYPENVEAIVPFDVEFESVDGYSDGDRFYFRTGNVYGVVALNTVNVDVVKRIYGRLTGECNFTFYSLLIPELPKVKRENLESVELIPEKDVNFLYIISSDGDEYKILVEGDLIADRVEFAPLVGYRLFKFFGRKKVYFGVDYDKRVVVVRDGIADVYTTMKAKIN